MFNDAAAYRMLRKAFITWIVTNTYTLCQGADSFGTITAEFSEDMIEVKCKKYD